MSSISCRECYTNIGNTEKAGFGDESLRYLSVQDDTLSFTSMEEGREYMIENPRYNYLSEVNDAPWNLVSIRHALRKVSDIISIHNVSFVS